MRTLYIECNAGVSGDMLLGALSDLMDNPEEIDGMIKSIGIEGLESKTEIAEKCGIEGLRVHVTVDKVEEGDIEAEHHHHHHEHRHLGDVLDIIGNLNVSDRVKKDAMEIYRIIAEAESNIHGKPLSIVHFHEVGALDAIADIVGVCMLIERLDPEQIVVTPVRLGFGQVKCAHGILPVPAPATAYIIQGMPVYAGDFEGEFTTPTGAAIVKYFADRFERLPAMEVKDVGYGIGKKDFGIANILRVCIGDTKDSVSSVEEIECNIDDMTPEDVGEFIDTVLAQGALDASVTPCIMKKGRPGYLLSCVCRKNDTDALAKLILRNTSTIGVRIHGCDRYEMSSHKETVNTCYGDVGVKVSEGFGVRKWKAEHDDLSRIAHDNGISISEVRSKVDFE
ncbi:MAG: nickel pincer cofactor biosynthesis protein LarC [archaeon]|nr:nickel pincer cofactor biosynthesis protein LarC [archaeon]